jgi:predicted lipid-binding transport protein (Tim44 family)
MLIGNKLFLDPLTILVIAVAAIIGWRLWSVLGQRTGLEREWPKPIDQPQKLGPQTIDLELDKDQPVTKASWEKHAATDSPLAKGLISINARDKSFDPDSFLSGATKAYELINMAFAKGDKKSLQSLLSRDVMKDFANDIDRRTAASEQMAWQLVKVESAKLEDASLVGNGARIAVHFVSSVISSTIDKEGKTIEGHLTAIEKVEDIWSFERAVNASDPNWKLVATTPQ